MSNEIRKKERTATDIAIEINIIKQQTLQTVAAASFQIGKRLCEAKALVPTGEWLTYLQEQLDYKPTTAENLMRIYREYGDEQVDLLSGKSPAELFGNLNQSQMVAMFSLPIESRKELLEDHPELPEMSAREVQKLVKEKQEAEAEWGRERKQRERAEKLATDQADRADKVEAKLKKLKDERDRLQSQTSMIQEDAEEKNRKIAELEERLTYLQNQPIEVTYTEFTEEEKEKIRQEARAEAAKELETANRKAAASHAVQQINFSFKEIQRLFETIQDALKECAEREPETGRKLSAVIVDTLRKMAYEVNGDE
ncbi:MAG: DUF3102 domain-containing protein [Eubacteriales bacterium]|nr:DUF3102 domain-containing protein [Eubacteriales bacterium]